MCGIYGQINMKIDPTIAQRCLDLIRHRGPDGEGTYIDSENGILFAHCRLAVLDLSVNGKQPMLCCNGKYVITYNGEIFNYLEIRRELEAKGYRFFSNTDTEVIPAAYDEWGEDCLNHFNGMWAFVIYNREKKSYFASRDRFGIKPFFYSVIESGMVFASEMKAILPHIESPEINYETACGNYMSYSGTSESLIRQINRLPAGHYMIIDNTKKISVRRWWSTLDNIPEISREYENNVERFRELFIDACRIRMRSDVTLGTALSGGLDSSATVCTMNSIVNNNADETINSDAQHAFVACFPGTALDETQFAKKVTDYLGIGVTYVDINTEIAPEDFENMLFQFEEIYNTTPVPMVRLYQAVKDNGVTVTLDGHGADELFGGYPGDFRMAFPDAGLDVRRIKSIFDAIYDSAPHDGSSLDPGKRRIDIELYLRTWKSLMWRKMHPNAEADISYERGNPRWRKLSSFNRQLYVDTHKTILPTLLRNYDNYSMSCGVEIRMPFMDYRVVTMAFALEWDEKIRNGYSKSIIRDAMYGLMPREISHRKSKIGFNTPMAELMTGQMREYFDDIVHSSEFVNSDLIDSSFVRGKFETMWQKDRIGFAEAMESYVALAPYLWEKCFFKKIQQI